MASLKSIGRALRSRAQTASARSERFASVYYSLVSRDLSREAKAVAAGQNHYSRLEAAGASNLYLLRRNIHRLEKALIMRPRRSTFAADYILVTVEAFRRAVTSAEAVRYDSDLAWSRDVLHEYFRIVKDEKPSIKAARVLFAEIDNSDLPIGNRLPFTRGEGPRPRLEFEDLYDLFRYRRSVRWFQDRPVQRDLIDKAIAAAVQSPSACNRQPYVFHVFDEAEQAHRVTDLAMGTKGFSHQVPAVAVLVGQLRAYPFARDRHAIYIDGSLAAMSFMYALESLGIASCAINWPDQEPHETRMRNELSLDADERVIMLIAFGWPLAEGQVPRSIKRDIDVARIYRSDV